VSRQGQITVSRVQFSFTNIAVNHSRAGIAGSQTTETQQPEPVRS
jgi:hypothetical protein